MDECCIFTVSLSLEAGVDLVQRIKAHAPAASEQHTEAEEQSLGGSGRLIPWTISNRYYTAPVHFAVQPFGVVSAAHLEAGPPAIIFVWHEGDEYKKPIQELSKMMAAAEYEPEVALAVRLDGEEDSDDLDAELMELGFEFIDARDVPATDDVARIPRMVDALSTIMWSSMGGDDFGDFKDEDDDEENRFEDDFDPEYAVLSDDELVPSEAEVRAMHSRLFAGDDLVGRLSELKAEIGEMSGDEKRKAAAAAALGIVYGM